MYRYEEVRSRLFSDEGQRQFLQIRDFVHETLKTAGAVTAQKAMEAGRGGDSWTLLACVDRLVELREIREIPQTDVAAQHRVFVEY